MKNKNKKNKGNSFFCANSIDSANASAKVEEGETADIEIGSCRSRTWVPFTKISIKQSAFQKKGVRAFGSEKTLNTKNLCFRIWVNREVVTPDFCFIFRIL